MGNKMKKSCRDCIHCALCTEGFDLDGLEKTFDQCSYFEDKRRYVKLSASERYPEDPIIETYTRTVELTFNKIICPVCGELIAEVGEGVPYFCVCEKCGWKPKQS